MNRSLFQTVDELASLEERPEAQVLLRGLSTPPAPPWDQARAADLEARLQSPLPADTVMWSLKRLETWRPGAPGRFVAGYARRGDVGEGLEVLKTFDGRELTFRFLSAALRRQQAKRIFASGAVAAVSSLVLAISIATAVQTRNAATVELDRLEQRIDRQDRLNNGQALILQREQILNGAGLTTQLPSGALEDLAWIAEHKTEAVNLEGLLWEPGLAAVEVRGAENPFVAGDRTIRRADKVVRPGVVLWGVDTAAAKDADH